MRNDEYNYWISNIPNIGIKKIEHLIQIFGSPREVFHASRKAMEQFKENCKIEGLRFGALDLENLIHSRDEEKVKKEYAKLQSSGIYFVSKEDDAYPNKLRQIYGSPFSLYIKGCMPKEEEKVIAIVGARDCSPYGKEMAKYFAGSLAKTGITIISGLARGVDAYAHEGALTAGGITYGVLGCGIDICYPKENINLFMEMQNSGGVLSEYGPGIQPYAGNFPMRNRIISGLCDGILVIEAKEKSGSLITVDMGLEQGKEIYALPGRVTDRFSGGCNNLIKMGAKLVTKPADILEDYLLNYEQTVQEMKKNNKLLESNGKIVYAHLCLEPKHIEEITVQSGLTLDIVMEQLLLLELRGLVKQTMKNYYVAQD
jgi:DNA processing protein